MLAVDTECRRETCERICLNVGSIAARQMIERNTFGSNPWPRNKNDSQNVIIKFIETFLSIFGIDIYLEGVICRRMGCCLSTQT